MTRRESVVTREFSSTAYPIVESVKMLPVSPLRKCCSRVSLTLVVAVVSMGWSASARAEDPVFSGPQPEEKLTGFELMGVYDQLAGKSFDPVAEAAGKPTLLIFVHKLTRPGFALTRGLAKYASTVGKSKGYVAVAWLSDDKAEAEQYLNRARKSLNLEVPLGVSVDGGEGPGAYGLNRNVELTILVADENKVTANFALVQPSPTEAVKIAGAYAKVLGIEPPTQEELREIAFGQQMRRMNQRQRGGQTERGRQTERRERGNTRAKSESTEGDSAAGE